MKDNIFKELIDDYIKLLKREEEGNVTLFYNHYDFFKEKLITKEWYKEHIIEKRENLSTDIKLIIFDMNETLIDRFKNEIYTDYMKKMDNSLNEKYRINNLYTNFINNLKENALLGSSVDYFHNNLIYFIINKLKIKLNFNDIKNDVFEIKNNLEKKNNYKTKFIDDNIEDIFNKIKKKGIKIAILSMSTEEKIKQVLANINQEDIYIYMENVIILMKQNHFQIVF